MRRSVIGCALLITLLFTLSTGEVALGHMSLKVNGEVAELQYPLIVKKGRTLVALEDLVRIFNLKAMYEERSKITVEGKHPSIELSLDGGEDITEAVTIDNTVYIPLRFVAESFGAKVTWLPDTQAIAIVTGDASSLEPSLEYTTVNRVELQSDSRLSSWFERNHRNKGAYSIVIEADTYVLISAGAKPTGGFRLNLESIVMAKPGVVLVTARLQAPKPSEIVTMAFTYPNIILRFPNQTFDEVDMVLHDTDQPSELIQPKIMIKE